MKNYTGLIDIKTFGFSSVATVSCGRPLMLVAAFFAILGSIGLFPDLAYAASEGNGARMDLTTHWVGYASVGIFVFAYFFVMVEEFTHLCKSKPVILAAGIIWALIGGIYAANGFTHEAETAVRHNILEYAELFLLVAMT